MMDIENLSPHKTRLHQRDLGQLVRVDELPEDQVTELFKGLEDDEQKSSSSGSRSQDDGMSQPDTPTVDAKKLVVTDPQEQIKQLRKLVNWEKSNATPDQKEEFMN